MEQNNRFTYQDNQFTGECLPWKNAMYSSTMVRVTCRGLDAPNPRIECSVKNIPLVIRIR